MTWPLRGRRQIIGRSRKQFFFEKKNQKTFSRCCARRIGWLFALLLAFAGVARGTPADPVQDPANERNPSAVFFAAMDRNCPEHGWRDATTRSYETPLSGLEHFVRPRRAAALARDRDDICHGPWEGCRNFMTLGLLIDAGRLPDIIRAFCAVEPEHSK
jgi:hypothetical protein